MSALMIRDTANKALLNPVRAFRVAKSIIRGSYYKAKYKLLGKDVRIGNNFRVVSGFSIKGPGKVIIGDNVVANGTSHPVTPWTTRKDAEIVIGSNTFLNGTRFGCSKRIQVGENCILADCRIMDTDFHSIHPLRRNDPELIQSAQITIGNNVWVAMGCVILKGVTIGDNTTISAQSVVYSDVEADSVYGGNPAALLTKLTRIG